MPDLPVILIEDNPDDEMLAIRAFRSLGKSCRVRVMRDGVEALEHFQNTQEKPKLIVLDLKLPRISGKEVLKNLRSTSWLETVPIVILSSSCEPVDVGECYRLGANSFVQKPISFDEFLETVSLMGRYWLTKNVALEV